MIGVAMKRDNDAKSQKFKMQSKVNKSSLLVDSKDFDNIEPVQVKPLEVKVVNDNFDKALRAFRAMVQKERVLSIYKEKQAYEKPSDRRRRLFNEMKRKMLEISAKNSSGNAKKAKNKK